MTSPSDETSAPVLVERLRAKLVLTDAEMLARSYVTVGIVPWRVYRIGGYGPPANDNHDLERGDA